MLTPVPERVAVVACTTCRRPADAPDAPAAGARLAQALRAAAAEPHYRGLAVEEMACLFACRAACAVHLRGPGRIGYVLGGFAPDPFAARALLDYALAYAATAEGEVAYRDWPEGVKGRFLARIPPPGRLIA